MNHLSAERPHRLAPALTYGWVLGLYFFLTLALTWPLARHVSEGIPGDAFDGWQNYWNLWWVKAAIIDGLSHPYFTDALYHPTGVALWFQTMNIFNGLASLPFQLSGNLYVAYNAVVLFSFTFAGFGTYLLALWVYGQRQAGWGWASQMGAIVAGLIFTFSPFHFAHLLGHMQVFSLQFFPFYILYLLRAVSGDRQKRGLRDALMAALFLILAALCDWYFALYLGLFTVLTMIWLMMRRQLRRRHVRNVALIGALTGLATLPLTVPMILESIRFDFMRPPPGQISELSADILSFLIPSSQHPMWGDWALALRAELPASPSENTLYIGAAVLALALYGLWRPLLSLPFWALTALLFALFALGPELHFGGSTVTLPSGNPLPMPYAFILKLPFVEIARTVARYHILVMLSMGILAGAGLTTLLRTYSKRWIALLAIFLILFEFTPLPYPISLPDTPAWYATLAQNASPQAILNVPMNWDRPGYLLYQTEHEKPLTAGYITRTDPRTYPTRIPIVSAFRYLQYDINHVDPATYAPTIWEFMDIGWVVSDRYKMPGGRERSFTEALLQEIFAQNDPDYEDDRITVFKTAPPDQRLPFIELGVDWGELSAEGTRELPGQATMTIHSPDQRAAVIHVRPLSETAGAIGLSANGQPLAALEGDPWRWQIDLVPGPNQVRLTTDAADIKIQQVKLESLEILSYDAE